MESGSTTVSAVDDDPGIRRALARLLVASGFRMRVFSSAEELLDSGAAGASACLILDVQLPGMSGFDLLNQLAEAGPKPAVIFITAFDKPALRQQATDAGAAGYFVKPFSGHDLVATLRNATRTTERPPATGAASPQFSTSTPNQMSR